MARRMSLPAWSRIVRDPSVSYGSDGTSPIVDATGLRAIVAPRMEHEEVEIFAAVYLDGKNRPLARQEVSRGTLTAALVHPREVYRLALVLGAAAVAVAHNHPSGDPTPSAEDKALTERMKQVGDLIGVRLLDHVVIGAHGRFTSFVESGLL